MTRIFNVDCPECLGSSYCDIELYHLDIELLCPYCGLYFHKEESPRVVAPRDLTHDITTTTGQELGHFKIFKPETPLRFKRG